MGKAYYRDHGPWPRKTGPRRFYARRAAPKVLCVRCRKAVSLGGWKKHARVCFGFTHCHACELPFPCPSERCPWGVLSFPEIPEPLIPYFTWRRSNRLPPKQTPEWLALEPAAHAWLRRLERNGIVVKKG